MFAFEGVNNLWQVCQIAYTHWLAIVPNKGFESGIPDILKSQIDGVRQDIRQHHHLFVRKLTFPWIKNLGQAIAPFLLPLLSKRGSQILSRQHYENEATDNAVVKKPWRLLFHWNQRLLREQFQGAWYLSTIPQDFRVQRFSNELVYGYIWKWHSIVPWRTAHKGNATIISNRNPGQWQKHITSLQNFGIRCSRVDGFDDHATLPFDHPQSTSHPRIL